MINKIRINLLKEGYHKVDVNIENIYIQYIDDNLDVSLIMLINNKSGNDFLEEQYNNIVRQVRNKFLKGNYREISILVITFTHSPEVVKIFKSDDFFHWIIDERFNRLLIFENQPLDFSNVKGNIEKELLVSNREYSNVDSTSYRMQNNSFNFNKNKIKKFPLINLLIIIINIVVFITLEIKGGTNNTGFMLEYGASYWPYVTSGEYYRLFTYMFLHFGLLHLVNNMIILLFVGGNLEKTMGHARYLILYLCSGIVAGLASLGYNMYRDVRVVSAGASGAIFGVAGALLYIAIKYRGRLQEIGSSQIIIFLILSLYGGFTSPGTDNAAHIGGLIAGFILSKILYKKPKNSGVY